MLPVVSIIGRPNVGKSSLFNRLARSRAAIVHDMPGVTRDRKTAEVDLGECRITLIDTGGLITRDDDRFAAGIRSQVRAALDESMIAIFLCDAREGVMPEDREIAGMLRSFNKPVLLVENKCDHAKVAEQNAPSFYELGLGDPITISAEHNIGIDGLKSTIQELLGPEFAVVEAVSDEEPDAGIDPEDGEVDEPAVEEGPIRIAVVGRPNAGKSTLINRMLGQERMLVSEIPGTTRDAVDSLLEVDGKRYNLIDTAGIRRKRSIDSDVEKICVSMAFDAIGRCDVVLMIIDAADAITEQDARIAGYADEKGRAIVILANKWDTVMKTRRWRNEEHYEEELRYQLKYLGYAPVLCISGKTGRGVENILKMVDRVFAGYVKKVRTSEINKVLAAMTAEVPLPVVAGRRVKFYYGAQTGKRPPAFTVVTNRPEAIHFSYQRRLVNVLRDAFGFIGVPIKLHFKARRRRQL
ncbi:MAG: ribosome biogenesis GTPase Der [Myxococcota bacterium]